MDKKTSQKLEDKAFSFMYWSIMGLFSAFVAEVITRIPGAPFFGMVGISFVIIMLAGGLFFGVHKPKWSVLFGSGNKKRNATPIEK